MFMPSETVRGRECNTTSLVKRLTSMEQTVNDGEQMKLKSQLKKILPPLITDFHQTLSASSTHNKESSGQILRFYRAFVQSAGDRELSASVRSEKQSIIESYDYDYSGRALDTLETPLGLGIDGEVTNTDIYRRELHPRKSAGTEQPNFLWYSRDVNRESPWGSEDDEEHSLRAGAIPGTYRDHNKGTRRTGRMGHSIKWYAGRHQQFQPTPSQILQGDSGLPTPSPTHSSVSSLDARSRGERSRAHLDKHM